MREITLPDGPRIVTVWTGISVIEPLHIFTTFVFDHAGGKLLAERQYGTEEEALAGQYAVVRKWRGSS